METKRRRKELSLSRKIPRQSNPQITLGTAASDCGHSGQRLQFHQSSHNMLRRHPRSGSPLCSMENMRLVCCWQSRIELHRADWARQEVRHKNEIENFINKTPCANSRSYINNKHNRNRLKKTPLNYVAYFSMVEAQTSRKKWPNQQRLDKSSEQASETLTVGFQAMWQMEQNRITAGTQCSPIWWNLRVSMKQHNQWLVRGKPEPALTLSFIKKGKF